jgi:NADPH:quinone reductase-like Zn-dependent oxidoreductase
MQAIRWDRYGGPEVLRLEAVPMPEPGEEDVLVRVRAASVNRADLDMITGRPALMRMGIGIRRPRIHGLGLDAAGEVEAVGPAVTRYSPGDRVYSNLTVAGYGAFAEYACAPESAWHPIPDGLDFDRAATLPEAAVLAFQGLGRGEGVRPGDRVLVNGAAGSVGPFAIKLARLAGAEVTAVASGPKLDFLRSIGAHHAIDYRREDYTKGGRRFDRILDVVGDKSVFAARHALADGGRYVACGFSSTGRVFQTMVCGPLLSIGRRRSLGMLLAWKPNDGDDLAAVAALAVDGSLDPVIDRTFPLADVPEAMRVLAAHEAKGKLLIRV